MSLTARPRAALAADLDRQPLALGDQQQALLLDVLRRAGGEPVSYEELRDAGVEYPASVVSELELAGLPLERCHEGSSAACRLRGARLGQRHDDLADSAPGGDRHRHLPMRLLGSSDRAIARVDVSSATRATLECAQRAFAWLARHATGARSAASYATQAVRASLTALPERVGQVRARLHVEAQRARRLPSLPRRRRLDSRPPHPLRRAASARWLAPGALIAAVVAVTILAVGELAGKGQARHANARRQARSITPTARGTRRGSAPRQPASSAPPTQVSPALAAQLEARGHELLQADEPRSAVPVLREALSATGENLDGCVEPTSETCLTYAYALYDLGTALRLDRQPAAAVPILEQRLHIANQQPTVHDELQLARQEAGRQLASTSG